MNWVVVVATDISLRLLSNQWLVRLGDYLFGGDGWNRTSDTRGMNSVH